MARRRTGQNRRSFGRRMFRVPATPALKTVLWELRCPDCGLAAFDVETMPAGDEPFGPPPVRCACGGWYQLVGQAD